MMLLCERFGGVFRPLSTQSAVTTQTLGFGQNYLPSISQWSFWPADRGDQLVYGLVGKGPHLVVGAILNWMFDEQACRVESQRLGLGFGGIDEGRRCNEHAGKATTFEIGDVMHTA